jgi:hypothetical protein
MDPVREARVRRMVLDRSTWPGRALCMKRTDTRMDFGVIYEAEQPIVIHHHPHEGTGVWTYQTIDELIAAGWCVD